MKFSELSLLFLVVSELFYVNGQSQSPGKLSNAVIDNQSAYRITGKVIDENNLPAAGVRVYSLKFDEPSRGRVFAVYTDAAGKFSLNHVEPGNNSVQTSKEEDNYADTINGVLATTQPAIVTVDDLHPQPTVEIKLGKKSPRLIGKVIDSETRKPLADARLSFCLADKPSQCFSTSINADGIFNVLTPLLPFTAKISSATHKESNTLYSKGKDSVKSLVQMASGELRNVLIALKAN